MANTSTYSAKDIAAENVLTELEHAFCIDPDAVIKAFAKINIHISDRSHLGQIAAWSKSGQDIKGVNDNGTIIKFNTIDIIKNIPVNTERLNAPECTIKFD